MSMWALLDNNKEIAVFRCVFDDEARQGCVDEAIETGRAVILGERLALAEGVEIVKYSD